MQIRREMQALKGSKNPEPQIAITDLWVLSGITSFSKQDDDYDRIQLAMAVGKNIALLKSAKDCNGSIMRYAPRIIYNGTEPQNEELRTAINQNELSIYPREKFTILSIPSDQLNTKGQCLSIKALSIKNTTIGVITHAYHVPRFTRYLVEGTPTYPFLGTVKVYMYCVDRNFISRGIAECMEAEVQKIPGYIAKGDLARFPSAHVVTRRKNRCDCIARIVYSLFSIFKFMKR
jgi:hypothetical protein